MQRQPVWKIVLILLLAIIAILVNVYFMARGHAEDTECWVMCQPDSFVYVRMNPKKKSIEIGRLECGDMIYTDGIIKNGFLHVYGFVFEVGEGWINKGYIVYSQPYKPIFMETTISSNGRVAARKTIGGQRRCWLKDEQSIKVYMASEDWCVTNKGFVQTKYINIGR